MKRIWLGAILALFFVALLIILVVFVTRTKKSLDDTKQVEPTPVEEPSSESQTDAMMAKDVTFSKFALVTAVNSTYFDAALTLISSVHRYYLPDNYFGAIYVYDLGLQPHEIEKLQKLQMVKVCYLANEAMTFPELLEPKGHAYKFPMMLEASQWCEYIFWLDAGAMFWAPPTTLLQLLEQDEIFLVKDAHLNKDWTTFVARGIMDATSEELEGYQLCSGITGFKSQGKYRQMLSDAARFSGIKECVWGPDLYSTEEAEKTGILGHRHDQSISSILAVRYHAPTQPIQLYGEFNKPNLERFQSVIFVHRRSHTDHTSLKYAQ